ncbi:hypothetical protein Mal4_12400 [Maioricimonas rarisocia]|uniref:Uncharacterized protein n=1 Tax=Maioricimonas rarisocia TaxID=2528026 RepID=A0A517Z383_9PLAN|nr:hypothetical protein [Maioricimonas rarisocia]QDU36939.1 hypothetical protein Mal4_12400 [Maioricimonas rarisocia]
MATARLTLTQATTPSSSRSDQEFLEAIGWRSSAPAALRQAASAGDVEAYSVALQKHLAGRMKRPRARSAEVRTPLLLHPFWSVAEHGNSPSSEALAGLLHQAHEIETRLERARAKKKTKKPAASRTAKFSRQVIEACSSLRREGDPQAWDLVAILTLLCGTVRWVEPEASMALWRTGLEHSAVLLVDSDEPEPDDLAILTGPQLTLAGELPVTSGLVYDEIRGAGKLVRQGRRLLRDAVSAATDTDGTPHAKLLGQMSLWLAPFCRSAAFAERFETPWWNAKSSERFEDLVRVVAEVSRPAGELALCNGASRAPLSLLRTAASLVGMSRKDPVFRSLLSATDDEAELASPSGEGPQKSGRPKRKPRRSGVVKTSEEIESRQSDWAEWASLRTSWNDDADACVVAYHQERPRIELTAVGQPVISGEWDLHVDVGDAPLTPGPDWSCTCWFSDEEADYLELTQQIEGAAQIVRQVMLLKEDRLLYVADSVTQTGSDEFEYSMSLPLRDGFEGLQDSVTREAVLLGNGLRVRVLPAGLPQERTQPADGRLEVDGNAIRYTARARTGGLHASLILDWSPERHDSPVDWAPLTVAEDGQILSPSAAAASRVRVGRQQWLMYRSLTSGKIARTVLGYHTSHETVIGRVDRRGDVEPLVLVEA